MCDGWIAPLDYEITYYDFPLLRDFRLWESSPDIFDIRLTLESDGLRTNYRMTLLFHDVRMVVFRDNDRCDFPMGMWLETEDLFLLPIEETLKPDKWSEAIWRDVTEGMRYAYGGRYDDPETQVHWLCRDVEWESIEPAES